jgi:hypothetical protein
MTAIEQWVKQYNKEVFLASGFEDALIGICERSDKDPVAVYDKAKCIQVLIKDFKFMQDKHEEEFDQELYTDAVEYFDSTIIKNYVGENSPVFLSLYQE